MIPQPNLIKVFEDFTFLVFFIVQAVLWGCFFNIRVLKINFASFPNSYLTLFFSFLTGVATQILALFLLGILKVLSPVSMAIVLLLLPLSAIFSFWRSAASVKPACRAFISRPGFIFLTGLFIYLFAAAVRAPGDWDDTMYHLPLARFYLEQKGIVLNPFVRFPLFPQNIDLLFTLCLAFGDVVLAQAMANLTLFFICVSFLGASRWLLDEEAWGMLACFLLLSLSVVKTTLGYAYIDNGLALFCWAGLLALGLSFRMNLSERRSSFVVLAGIFLGTAAGCKFFGLAWGGLVFFVWMALSFRRTGFWRDAVFGIIATLAFGLGWYLRSFCISGDPVNPMGGPHFGYFLWNAADLAAQISEQGSFGSTKNPLFFFQALAKAGVSIWVFAFASLYAVLRARRQDKVVILFYVSFFLYFWFWFFTTQVERYLSPVFGVASLMTVLFLFSFPIALRRGSPLFWKRVCVLVAVAFAIGQAIDGVKRLSDWNQTMNKRPGYAFYQIANALIPQMGNRLVQLEFENGIYFFVGTVIGDYFGPGRYSAMMACEPKCQLHDGASLVQQMHKFNSRMLLVNTRKIQVNLQDLEKYFFIEKQSNDGLFLTLRATSL